MTSLSKLMAEADDFAAAQKQLVYSWKSGKVKVELYGTYKSVEQIRTACEAALGYELTDDSRERHVVIVRAVFCFIASITTGEALKNIGSLCNFDHATVIHHRNKIKQHIETGDVYTVKSIERVIDALGLQLIIKRS